MNWSRNEVDNESARQFLAWPVTKLRGEMWAKPLYWGVCGGWQDGVKKRNLVKANTTPNLMQNNLLIFDLLPLLP